jgi:hypothetical protein
MTKPMFKTLTSIHDYEPSPGVVLGVLGLSPGQEEVSFPGKDVPRAYGQLQQLWLERERQLKQ